MHIVEFAESGALEYTLGIAFGRTSGVLGGDDVYRGTFAVVDLDAIRENVAAIRARLAPTTRVLVTVKANGYGHGAVEVARAAVQGGASYLAVASVEEGIALREAGIQTPVLVLGASTYESAMAAAKFQLDVTLTEDCLDWPDVPLSPPIKGHLKIDTGMTRLGVRTNEECVRLAQWILARSDVECQGAFTHLACADAETLHHAEQQIRRFQEMLGILSNVGLHPKLVHAANSAAALRRLDWQFDMVRIGISAYGYAPSDAFVPSVSLKPALNLYSFVTRVHTIQTGESVGYGATFTAPRVTKVATVPVGYADGYPRRLSNQSFVWVKGQRVPVIGNVCMDQLMIDVTDVDEVSTGDCVTLYGHRAPSDWTRQNLSHYGIGTDEALEWLRTTFRESAREEPVLSLDELANRLGTISYELMCALSPRVPRIYVK